MLLKIILLSGFSGITVFIDGLLANYFNHHIKNKPIKYEIIHAMMSFGAGIILSALALVLVPQGTGIISIGRYLPIWCGFIYAY